MTSGRTAACTGCFGPHPVTARPLDISARLNAYTDLRLPACCHVLGFELSDIVERLPPPGRSRARWRPAAAVCFPYRRGSDPSKVISSGRYSFCGRKRNDSCGASDIATSGAAIFPTLRSGSSVGDLLSTQLYACGSAPPCHKPPDPTEGSVHNRTPSPQRPPSRAVNKGRRGSDF